MARKALMWGCAAAVIFAVVGAVAVGIGAPRKIGARRALTLLTRLRATAHAAQPSSTSVKINRYHEPYQPQRLDAWQIIGPGGGGAFYSPTISPHDPNLIVATTDMTGCFISADGGKTWRQFNLRMSCRQFLFDPKLPNRIYAVAVAAGVYRSDDRGRTWGLFYPDPAKVRGVWYLDDEAEAYLQVLNYTAPMETVQSLAIDPDDSNVLFAAVGGELLTTADGGQHWRSLAKIGSAPQIFVDPSSPRNRRTVYVIGGFLTGVWDGAAFHGNLKHEPSGALWFKGVAYATPPGGKPVLYAASDYLVNNGVYEGGGVSGTHDGGLNWFSLNDGLLGSVTKGTFPEFTALATSLHHPEVIYASLYAWHMGDDKRPHYGVIKTADGGKTWFPVRREYSVTAPNMHDAWLSDRYGPDWADQPLAMDAGADNPDLLYATDLGRIMRTTDGGKNWEAVYSQGLANGYTTTGLDNTTCYGVHFDPFDPKHMFISYTDIGMFASEDGGKSWMSATNGVPRYWVNTTYWIEFDPQVRGRMWAVQSNIHDLPHLRMFHSRGSTANSRGGVVASTDGGKTWKVSNGGLPEIAATHILLDPKSPAGARVLYVTGFGKGVFKSTDGGKTWTAKNRGLPESEPLAWRLSLGGDDTLYLVTIRRSQNLQYGTADDGAVYRSRDGAESWERMKLPEGLNGPVSVTVDPQDAKRLYISAWGRYVLYGFGKEPQDGGVFLSTDGGERWSNVLAQNRRIYDVTVDPRNPDVVYAAGTEAAVWRSADRGLTWKRIRGFNFKQAQRVVPSPTDPAKIYVTTFGSSVWYGPAEGDPEAPEDIVSPPSLRFDAPQMRAAPKK